MSDIVQLAGTTAVQADRATINSNIQYLQEHFRSNTAPASPRAGQVWIDSSGAVDIWKVRNRANTAWVAVFLDLSVAGGGLLPLTGGTMSGAIAMGGNEITGLGNATAADEAVNRGQVDARVLATGAAFIGPVSATATIPLWETPSICDIVDVRLVSWGAGLAINAAAYYIFEVWNATAGNALQTGAVGPPPTGALLAGSTYSPGGTAFVADTWRSLGVDQNNLAVAAGSSLQLRTTMVGAPAALPVVAAIIRYRVAT